MKLLSYFQSVARKFFYRSRVEDDLNDEFRSHVQHRADDLERKGLDRADAERRARMEFGGHIRFKEDSNTAMGGNFIEVLIQDVRFSLRVLRKAPGFTVAAVLTLALGIGANAVVFSVMNGLILHPLNVPEEESLYSLQRGANKAGNSSYPDYKDLRDRNRSFDGLAGYNITQVGLDTGDNTSPAWILEVSGNYFDALRIQPSFGRFFHADDEHGPNSAPYIVLSSTYWHVHFQDDREVIGRVVQVNKHPFTIIGVAPPGFHGTLVIFSPDFFLPLVNHEQVSGENSLDVRANHWVFNVFGHLRPGVTPAQAVADLNSIGADLEKTYPKEDSQLYFTLSRPGLYGDFLGGPVQAFLTGLLVLAGLVLLAACANLGSLFAARAADRGREVALRLALGASRTRILRQLFTEAIMISLVGGVVGLLGSVVLLRALSAWQPFPRFPIIVPVNPDVYVYGIALLLAIVSGLLFGAVPVRQVLHTNPYEIIKSGTTGSVGRKVTVRDLLLVAQIAICAVLVTSSLVAVRGLVRSLHSNFGFEPNNVILASTELSAAGYTGDKIPAMQKRMVDAVAAIPGVQSVAFVDRYPLGMDWDYSPVFTDDAVDLRVGNAVATAMIYKVSPDYFQAAGTSMLSGRIFTLHDDENAPRVAIVNQEFVRKVFGSTIGVEGRYYKDREGNRILVVGVAENGKYINLAEDQRPAMFYPIKQRPASRSSLVVRSSGDPVQLIPNIRSTLRSLDSGLPIYIVTWNKELTDSAMFASRMATMSLGVMGVMGAMLAVTGIFGMAAYSVSKRLRELGIRMALGAQRKELLQAALGRAFKLLTFGSAAGLLLGIFASNLLASIVYQATPRDPIVLAGVVVAMALFGLLATWIPARRAMSADPLRLLREE